MPIHICAPEQVRALQTAFDRVWISVGPTYGLSKDDVAKLVVALAGDNEIDIDKLVFRTLSAVMADVALVRHRFMWSTYASSTPWLLSENVRPLLLH